MSRLAELLNIIPESWMGTTYPNDARFVGRHAFMKEIERILRGSFPIEKNQLASMYPEDYERLGSPLSTVLETIRGMELGYTPTNTFAFGSTTLPLITVAFVSTAPIYVYGPRLLKEEAEALLESVYGCRFTCCTGAPEAHGADAVILQVTDQKLRREDVDPVVDAVIGTDGFLYILNEEKIPEKKIHTKRKRLGAPPPTPDALSLLRGEPPVLAEPDTAGLEQHLKALAGCSDASGDVLVTMVGLSAMGAVVMAALEVSGGGIDSVMCSTAYGGSSQQTDILSARVNEAYSSHRFQKHTFDIQGPAGDVFTSLSETLDAIAKSGDTKALTMVALEYPTNPDMKDCDLSKLEPVLLEFSQTTGSDVLLVLDTTLSPISRPGRFLHQVPLIVFNSLSKSVSGGKTIGGSLVANAHPLAQRVLRSAHDHSSLFDSGSKVSQRHILNAMHAGCEERVASAHANAIVCGAAVEKSTLEHSGVVMKVNFVTAAQIAKDVTPATFSFNLPAPEHMQGDSKALAALAQDVVDQLVEEYPAGVKPCVSFGQENTVVYATVPATSTQGVISEKDKAKQAVGGVQLVRFSFPPRMDLKAWIAAFDGSMKRLYAGGDPS